jgi:queuine tRNA-ribosyltransferase
LDSSPLDENCDCPVCRNFSKAYLRHLFCAGEMLGMRLGVIHNLYFYNKLMETIRIKIENNEFAQWKEEILPVISKRI